jgi:hypothetical protein
LATIVQPAASAAAHFHPNQGSAKESSRRSTYHNRLFQGQPKAARQALNGTARPQAAPHNPRNIAALTMAPPHDIKGETKWLFPASTDFMNANSF